MSKKQFNINETKALYEAFRTADTLNDIRSTFAKLCKRLGVDCHDGKSPFYPRFREAIDHVWQAKQLLKSIDKRANMIEYEQGQACRNVKSLVVGAGPCGMRVAIELALLGARVVLVEKRDAFARNNILHLWPFTTDDLNILGAKKFYGQFCSGSLEHISIRKLQEILLKVCLIVGVHVHVNVEFVGLVEPTADKKHGWRASWKPDNHALSAYEFDVIIDAGGSGGKRLDGFKVKECRGKLAIGITANFVKLNSREEMNVQEISGVASIYHQTFFHELYDATGINLENIVYYKGDTHYFVMTAKKTSLLGKKVLKKNHADGARLLSSENVDRDALERYAREAADYATGLPRLEFARNPRGDADVAVFDFTCMRRGEHSSLVREVHGAPLLLGLAGDSLLEPFWPLGTGCARGFLAAFDMAWMVLGWAKGRPPLELLAERESVFKLLTQTCSNNISKHTKNFSINPATRYPNLNLKACRPNQVAPLYIGGSKNKRKAIDNSPVNNNEETVHTESVSEPPRPRPVPALRRNSLLKWCQECTQGYHGVNITDFSASWRSGLALCALINRFYPDLIAFNKLDPEDALENNRLAFEAAERELSIVPTTTPEEMVCHDGGPDQLAMVAYLTCFYNLLGNNPPPTGAISRKRTTIKNKSPTVLASKLRQTFNNRRKTMEGSRRNAVRKLKPGEAAPNKDSCVSDPPSQTKETVPPVPAARKKLPSASKQTETAAVGPPGEAPPLLSKKATMAKEPQSSVCFFCRKHVYVLQRLSAEGKFFHRECFRCNHCETGLHLGDYAFDDEEEKFYCKPHFCFRKSPTFSTRRRMFEKMRQTVRITLDNKKKKLETQKLDDHSKEKSKQTSEQEALVETAKNERNTPADGACPSPQRSLEEAETSRPANEKSVGQESVKMATKPEETINPDVTHEPATSVPQEPHDQDKAVAPGSKDADELEQPKKPQSIWKRFKRIFRSRSLTDLREVQITSGKAESEQDEEVNENCERGVKLSRRFSMRGTGKRLRRTLSLPIRPSAKSSELHVKRSAARTPLQAEAEGAEAPPRAGKEGPEPRGGGQLRQGETESPATPVKPTPPAKPPRNLASASPLSPKIRNTVGATEARDAAKGKGVEEANGVSQKTDEAAADVQTPPLVSGDEERTSDRGRGGGASGVERSDAAAVEADESTNGEKFPPRELRRKNATKSKTSVSHDGAETDALAAVATKGRDGRPPLRDARCPSNEDSDSTGSVGSEDEGEDFAPQRQLTQRQLTQRRERRDRRESERRERHHELQRLNVAQVLQRELQEVEEMQRILEEEGVEIEKRIRGDGADSESPTLMQEWFKLIGEKNLLLRRESELVVRIQELELEDRQGRLQQRLDELNALTSSEYDEEEREELDRLLQEKMEVVDQRDTLVILLEEQRLLEREEDGGVCGLSLLD